MIKRDLYQKIRPYLEEKEILLIIGPRQSGKTTLMKMLERELIKKGKRTVFFNLDIERDHQFFVNQERFVSELKLRLGKGEGYVFIDEIERKENVGLFLKGLYDMNLPYKFIVSGSGSLELKAKINEALTGRKFTFQLNPLSFKEFVNYKTQYLYEDHWEQFFINDPIKAQALFEEYLSFGGYPRVVVEDDLEKKNRVINEIYQSYLEKDLVYLLGLRKTPGLTFLVKILASSLGRLVNISELSNTLGLSIPTIKNYLFLLEKTFIVRKLTPFFSNVRKEITKTPVYYFYDLGMVNFVLNRFYRQTEREIDGFLFQNFVANILFYFFSDQPINIYFWRTKEKNEIDFIIDMKKEIIPVEVKYQRLKKEKTPRAFLSFFKKYPVNRAWVINLDFKKKIKEKKVAIDFFPYWHLSSFKNG